MLVLVLYGQCAFTRRTIINSGPEFKSTYVEFDFQYEGAKPVQGLYKNYHRALTMMLSDRVLEIGLYVRGPHRK
jgi:hypothetical protein